VIGIGVVCVKKEAKMDTRRSKIRKQLRDFDEWVNHSVLSIMALSQMLGRSRPSIWSDLMRGFFVHSDEFGSHTVKWLAGDFRQFLNGGSINGR